MNQPIIITSWNMGASIADFEMKNRELQNLPPDSRGIKRSELIAIYAKIDEIAAQHLFSRKCDAGNIVMLQENMKKEQGDGVFIDRHEITKLSSLGYQFIHWQGKQAATFGPDLSIAIDPDRFSALNSVQHEYPNGSKTLGVITKDNGTGKTIAFISLIIAGSRLTGDPAQDEELGRNATEDCHQMISWLENIAKDVEYICVGGDFNANPECMANRFDIFIKAGYQLLRTNRPTELNYIQTEARPNRYNERELDFFLVYAKPSSFFASLFTHKSRIQQIAEPTLLGAFDIHGSDHAPIQATLLFD